jgi:transposase
VLPKEYFGNRISPINREIKRVKTSWFDKKYNRHDLPNDVESLKDIIDGLVSTVHLLQQQNILLQQEVMDLRYQNEELKKEVIELREENTQLKQESIQLKQEIEELRGEIKLLKQEKFGKKSEKRGKHPHRTLRKEGPRKKHPGRQPLPQHLERVRVEHDLSEEEKRCPLCHEMMEKIQEITTEQLDLVPAVLQVKQHVRFQYACRKCYGSIRRAEMPAQPIDKGLPTSRLIAQVMMSKFADHMPFYRQESWFARQKCPITRSTLWGWEAKAAFELLPLVNCLKREIQGRDHIFGDDTPMPTIEEGLGRNENRTFLDVYVSKE